MNLLPQHRYYYKNDTFLILINISYLINDYSPDDFEFLKDKNYHIIITHGVVGELFLFIKNKNFYNLNKNNFTILSNNIELSIELSRLKINHINISESIFINDDLYYINKQPKI